MTNILGEKIKTDGRNRNLKNIYYGILFLLTINSACSPASPSSTPEKTIIPTVIQTPTEIWFPATATSSPIPEVIPSTTPDFHPGVGKKIIDEDFQNSDHWITGSTGQGTIAITNNEISLAITQPRGYLASFRDGPIFNDFYAEIMAAPSLCAGTDEYGLLIRYNSPVDFYRFSLSCDGRTRLDKLSGGTASSPQPWLVSASIPSAAPSFSKIGVWVLGKEMRFFINDEYQFTVNDPTIPAGLIGVFTRSGGENAVTVSFSDLVVYEIDI